MENKKRKTDDPPDSKRSSTNEMQLNISDPGYGSDGLSIDSDSKPKHHRFSSARRTLNKIKGKFSSSTGDKAHTTLLTNDQLAGRPPLSPSNGVLSGEEREQNSSWRQRFPASPNGSPIDSPRRTLHSTANNFDDSGSALPRPTVPTPRGVHMPAPQPQMSTEPPIATIKEESSLDDPLPTPDRRLPTRQGRLLAVGEQSLEHEKPIRTKRRYEQWRGNNIFFMNGKIMVGVHYRQLFVTTGLILVTWIAFLGHIGWHMETYFFFGGLVLMILSLIFLVITAMRDPGIIPRQPPSQLIESMPLEMKEKMNYCPTCHIVRPPRTKHCRHCNNCIAVFDHHCPWTGNCIGVRNYRFFYCFLISVTASSVYVLAMSGHYLTRHFIGPSHYFAVIFRDSWRAPGGQFVTPLIMVWTLLVSVLVGALLTFHIILLSRGQTTNEYLRGERNRGDIPHGNILINCYHLWCADIPESNLLPMWDFPNEEDDKRNMEAAEKAMYSLKDAMEAKVEEDFFYEPEDEERKSAKSVEMNNIPKAAGGEERTEGPEVRRSSVSRVDDIEANQMGQPEEQPPESPQEEKRRF